MVTTTRLNETWDFVKEGVNYVGFRMFVPLAQKQFYSIGEDWIGGANEVGGRFIFVEEFATEPEQVDVEAKLPL